MVYLLKMVISHSHVSWPKGACYKTTNMISMIFLYSWPRHKVKPPPMNYSLIKFYPFKSTKFTSIDDLLSTVDSVPSTPLLSIVLYPVEGSYVSFLAARNRRQPHLHPVPFRTCRSRTMHHRSSRRCNLRWDPCWVCALACCVLFFWDSRAIPSLGWCWLLLIPTRWCPASCKLVYKPY